MSYIFQVLVKIVTEENTPLMKGQKRNNHYLSHMESHFKGKGLGRIKEKKRAKRTRGNGDEAAAACHITLERFFFF